MIATVLFTYDQYSKKEKPTEQQIFDHVLNWKPRWKGDKEPIILSTICDLSALGWINPRQDMGLLSGGDFF